MNKSQDFWSRRKAAVDAETVAIARDEAQAQVADEQQRLEELSEEEVLADLGLPDPDTLEMGDDFSGFMAKAVPERLRRRALRRLWLSNPTLANLDQLVDYGEDFTDAAMVVENMQTTYQVGKGMLKHIEEMARQAEEKAKAADAETEDDPQPDEQPDEGPEGLAAIDDDDTQDPDICGDTIKEVTRQDTGTSGDRIGVIDAAAEYAAEYAEDETEALPATAKRRMRFNYA